MRGTSVLDDDSMLDERHIRVYTHAPSIEKLDYTFKFLSRDGA